MLKAEVEQLIRIKTFLGNVKAIGIGTVIQDVLPGVELPDAGWSRDSKNSLKSPEGEWGVVARPVPDRDNELQIVLSTKRTQGHHRISLDVVTIRYAEFDESSVVNITGDKREYAGMIRDSLGAAEKPLTDALRRAVKNPEKKRIPCL